MKKYFLTLAVLVLSISWISLAQESCVPHAYIARWTPGVRCSANLAHHFKHEKPLPIWVAISFDREPTTDFVSNYFRFLVGHVPGKHKKNNYEFIITVDVSTTRQAFEIKIDKANRHFDPEIERREQLAIQKAEAKVAERLAAEVEARRKTEEGKLRLEVEKKAEAERRAKDEALRLEVEAEQRAIAKAKAEETARILAIQREQERIEAERKQKAIEQEEQLKESNLHSYSCTKLPKDFHILGGYYAFNNHGQIVGCVSKKATVWEPIYNRGRRGTYCVNALEDKYEDAVAACWEGSFGLHIFDEKDNASIAKAINDAGLVLVSLGKKNDKKQSILWDIDTGKSKIGPIGDPYFITNKNIVLVNDGDSSIIWNPADNTVTNDVRKNLYMTDDGKLHGDYYLMMNKEGSRIRVEENLTLQCSGNNYLLLTVGNSRVLALNDNNQVAALVDIKWGTKDFKAIQILDKYGNSLRSKVIRELEGYSYIAIIGFNTRGQLLLSADKDYLLLDSNS